MKPSSRLVSASAVLLAWTGTVLAGDTITAGKIKVQLFAAPSFLSEVSVDAYNNQCLSLDNNLYVARSTPGSSRIEQGIVLTKGKQHRWARAKYPGGRTRCQVCVGEG